MSDPEEDDLTQVQRLEIEPLSDQDLDSVSGGLAAATDGDHCTEGCISFGPKCTNGCVIET